MGSIFQGMVELKRIACRDAQTYFAILLDDNNRKTICRLYFNGLKKYLVLLDETKKETKYEVAGIDDLYDYSQQLVEVAGRLANSKVLS